MNPFDLIINHKEFKSYWIISKKMSKDIKDILINTMTFEFIFHLMTNLIFLLDSNNDYIGRFSKFSSETMKIVILERDLTFDLH